MNSKLQPQVFNIPQNILDKISQNVASLNGQYVHGLNRAQNLLKDKSVKYGQLKRIIHDLQSIDKVKDKQRYDLFGGDEMEKWAEPYLQGERNLVSARQDSKQMAQNIAGTGEEKNSHLKKHTKKPDSLTSMNMVKPSSHKTSISAAGSLKLFEEVEKIKKLML
jgi:hypothetical protein